MLLTLYVWGIFVTTMLTILLFDALNHMDEYTESREITLSHSVFIGILWPMIVMMGIGYLIQWSFKVLRSDRHI